MMTPIEKANQLIEMFKKETDGIAAYDYSKVNIECAKLTANEMIEYISKDADYGGYKVRYWKNVLNELHAL